jgi:hypothetical protein
MQQVILVEFAGKGVYGGESRPRALHHGKRDRAI